MTSTRRRFVGSLAAALAAWRAFDARAQETLPDGVPVGSTEAVVTGYEDGDKYRVTIAGSEATVLMISADAPEEGRCFFNAASKHLKELIPIGTTVYLEQDGDSEDKKGRLLRYTWKPREGKTAQLIDERMIADGYAHFKAREGHAKRDARLAKAEETAKSNKRGIWADYACTPSAKPKTPTPAPTPTATMEGSNQPLAYSVIEDSDVSFGDHNRRRMRIVVDGFVDGMADGYVLATMQGAFQAAFTEHGTTDAIVIFAYRPNTDVDSLFSLARGVATKSGNGWDNNGNLLDLGDDNGKARIEVTDWVYEYGINGDIRSYEIDVF